MPARSWDFVLFAAAVATIPAAWAGGGAWSQIASYEPVPAGDAWLSLTLVAAAALWSAGAVGYVLRRAGWPDRRPAGAAFAVVGVVVAGYAAGVVLDRSVVGDAWLLAFAMPEVALAALTVRRWADLAWRAVVGVVAIPLGYFVAYAIGLMIFVGGSVLGKSAENAVALAGLGVAFALGHTVVFLASGLGYVIAERVRVR